MMWKRVCDASTIMYAVGSRGGEEAAERERPKKKRSSESLAGLCSFDLPQPDLINLLALINPIPPSSLSYPPSFSRLYIPTAHSMNPARSVQRLGRLLPRSSIAAGLPAASRSFASSIPSLSKGASSPRGWTPTPFVTETVVCSIWS